MNEELYHTRLGSVKRHHSYLRREGTPGHYKYVYKKSSKTKNTKPLTRTTNTGTDTNTESGSDRVSRFLTNTATNMYNTAYEERVGVGNQVMSEMSDLSVRNLYSLATRNIKTLSSDDWNSILTSNRYMNSEELATRLVTRGKPVEYVETAVMINEAKNFIVQKANEIHDKLTGTSITAVTDGNKTYEAVRNRRH